MTAPGDSQAQNASKSDDGNKLSDALAGFAAEAVKWSSEPAPDPNVSTSFSLGWHVAQAVAWASTGKPPQDELGLEASLRRDILNDQIAAARKQLLDDTAPTPDDAAGLSGLQDDLLRALYVGDSALGKAFQLGLELQKLCVATRDARLCLAEHDAVERLLRDLASKLPANAAHSVMNSLSLWDGQLAPPAQGFLRPSVPEPPSKDLATEALARQKPIWDAMLAGEVAAKDLLRLSDYVGTGEEVVKRLRELATRALRTKTGWALLGLVLALFGGGVALLLLSNHVAVGVTSVLTAVGLTWKAIGDFFGRAAAKGEQALWDAQVDWTIAYRCTIPIVEPPDRRRRAKRKQRIDDHFGTWTGWLERWPGLTGEDPPAATRAAANAGRS